MRARRTRIVLVSRVSPSAAVALRASARSDDCADQWEGAVRDKPGGGEVRSVGSDTNVRYFYRRLLSPNAILRLHELRGYVGLNWSVELSGKECHRGETPFQDTNEIELQ